MSESKDTKPDDPLARHEREVQFFQALAHPARLRIVHLLAEAELCGCEIEPDLDLDQSTISRHLQVLRRAGILTSRKDGVRVLYRIRYPEVLEVLQDVGALLTEQAHEELARLTGPRP